jgi:hypothetical protein
MEEWWPATTVTKIALNRLRHSQEFDDGDSGRYWDELR